MGDLSKERKQNVICAKLNFYDGNNAKVEILNRIVITLKDFFINKKEEKFDNGTWGLLDIETGEYGDYIIGRLFRYKSETIPKNENKTLATLTINDRVYWSNFLFDRDSQIFIFEYSNDISENQFLDKIQLIISLNGNIPAYELKIYDNIEEFKERVKALSVLMNIQFFLKSPNEPPAFIDDMKSAISDTIKETNAGKLNLEMESKENEPLKFSGDLIDMAIDMVEKSYGKAKVTGFDDKGKFCEIYSDEEYFQRNIKCNDLLSTIKDNYYKVRDQLIKKLNKLE